MLICTCGCVWLPRIKKQWAENSNKRYGFHINHLKLSDIYWYILERKKDMLKDLY